MNREVGKNSEIEEVASSVVVHSISPELGQGVKIAVYQPRSLDFEDDCFQFV